MALTLPASGDAIAWWRGDSLVDGGGGVASAWNDKTANGHNLTPINSPTIVTGFMGKQGTDLVRASSQFFEKRTQTWGGANSVVILCRNEELTVGTTKHLFDSAVSTALAQAIFNSTAGAGAWSMFAGSTLSGQLGSGVAANWMLIQADFNGANSDMWNWGMKMVATGTTGANTAEGFRIGSGRGAAATVNNAMDGQVMECAVYNKVLNSTERDDWLQYVGDYYLSEVTGGGIKMAGRGGLAG